MNIKFGMDNFYVRYLKRFLNSELSQTSTILGEFDKDDQQRLINYLNLPNVKDMFVVQKEIIQEFPELNTMFNMKLNDNVISWYSKIISRETADFIIERLDDLKKYCADCGWEINNLYEWMDETKDINSDGRIDQADVDILYNIIYNGAQYPTDIMKKADLNLDGIINEADLKILESYLLENKLNISIKKTERHNYFPNKDMLVFINQFDGTFMYNYALRNGLDVDDKPHKDEFQTHKIALYRCTPGQKVTIAHNSPKKARLVIGSSPVKLKQNLTSEILRDVIDIELAPGQSIEYTTSSKEEGAYDAHWLCIQCPSNYGDLTGQRKKTVMLEIGDINFDGKIDMEDYNILAQYTAIGPGSEKMPFNKVNWTPTEKEKAVMRVYNRPSEPFGTIDVYDAIYLLNYIERVPGTINPGLTAYTYTEFTDYAEGDNVENLLIIDGHYDKKINIPFKEFITDDWIIHEKFFNYLLNMSIHEHSSSEDISYLQKLLKEYYPEHSYDPTFFYPGKYSENMKLLIRDFQREQNYFFYGDVNLDNKLDNKDLTILRRYLDNLAGDINGDGYTDDKDLQLVDDYIKDKVTHPLTPEQFERADFNHDGVVDASDRKVLAAYVADQNLFSPTFKTRADINQDGYINEADYEILQNAIQGIGIEDLKQYTVPFILGWCDVQTEALLEDQVNISGNISEVSK